MFIATIVIHACTWGKKNISPSAILACHNRATVLRNLFKKATLIGIEHA